MGPRQDVGGSHRRAWSRSVIAIVAVIASTASMVACSGSDGSDGSAGPATTVVADGGPDADAGSTASAPGSDADSDTDTDAPVPEVFTGELDDFYVVPDPLPAGAPGDVIRTMAIEREGVAGLRIMYLSSDAEGDVRAATGVVYPPTGTAPDGGWPIVAWGHGTSGLVSSCAPSRWPADSPSYGIEGIRVAADYLGLGPAGEVHPYLSKAAEGNAIIDSVAAVRNLDLDAGDRWAVVGVSQGGHAALATGELAAERLPEAELVGVVAQAPGAELGSTFGDDLQARVITTLVLVGVAAEDPEVEVADYLSSDAADAAKVIEEGCMADIIGSMLGPAAEPDYFTVDPRSAPVGEAWLADNDPGSVAFDAPLLLAQGGQDVVVVPARTDAFEARLCRVGQVVHRVDAPTASHDSIVTDASTEIEAWLADRFAGAPAPDDC